MISYVIENLLNQTVAIVWSYDVYFFAIVDAIIHAYLLRSYMGLNIPLTIVVLLQMHV